jgi:membrane protein YqaA with SNARE-associated domain
MRLLETRLVSALTKRADQPSFPLGVGAAALAATLSMSVPFASLLIAAVLMAPRRWRSIALCSSLGAALGAALLYLAFHHLGWARLFAAYPEVVRSAAWADATRWLSRYGVAALLVLAALPLPLTPALMFAAISRLPVAEVLLALWLGKLAKYLVYAGLTATFPRRLLQHGHARVAALNSALVRATHAVPSGDPRRDL